MTNLATRGRGVTGEATRTVTDSPEARRDPLDIVADEIAERFRRGELPELGEYKQRYPELATEIETMFPGIRAMEAVGWSETDDSFVPDFVSSRWECVRELGEYKLVREIGRGGMGVVYEAEHGPLGRRVALKVLPPQAGISSVQLDRFRLEARVAGGLHHPNIVPVHGVGERDGVHFYVMPLIDGKGLDHVIEQLRAIRARDDLTSLDARSASPPCDVLPVSSCLESFIVDSSARPGRADDEPFDEFRILS